MYSFSLRILVHAIALLFLFGCRPDGQEIIVPDNYAEHYEGVPTLKVENYLNRIYIDLLGREPLQTEKERDIALLRAANLGKEARATLIEKLQTNADFVPGDSSYRYTYYLKLYEQGKARLLEGVSDEDIRDQIGIYRSELVKDSLEGNWVSVDLIRSKMLRLDQLLTIPTQYDQGEIQINEVYRRMLDNYFYDFINMNSINFIRACFDNLFFRYPTDAEFENSFPIIEYNISSTIFGKSAQNKQEYIEVLINSREFHEGIIRFAYKSLLSRDPSTQEVVTAMDDFFITKDFQSLQSNLMITDEYANF